MQIVLTTEQEARLSHLASQEGRGVDELAQDLLDRGLADETRFLVAVKMGQDAAARGEFVDSPEVWAGVERSLQS